MEISSNMLEVSLVCKRWIQKSYSVVFEMGSNVLAVEFDKMGLSCQKVKFCMLDDSYRL